MTDLPPASPPPPTPTSTSRSDIGTYFFLGLAALWIVLVTAGGHALAWFSDQSVLMLSDRALPA